MFKEFNQLQMMPLKWKCNSLNINSFDFSSAVKKKYYDDPFIFEMEPKKNHKIFLPILNLGTWTRLNAIKTSVDKILTTFQENEPNLKINILNLGAGFDTMYFLLKQKFNNFIEKNKMPRNKRNKVTYVCWRWFLGCKSTNLMLKKQTQIWRK